MMGREVSGEMGRDQRLNNDNQTQRQVETAAAGPRIVDRFNRPLWKGVQVELHEPLPIVFEITELTPVIDPRQPAGLWTLKLQATVVFPVSNGQPVVALTGIAWPKTKPGLQELPTPPAGADAAPAQTPAQDSDAGAGPAEYVPPDGEGSSR
jgi:hypothetical protein